MLAGCTPWPEAYAARYRAAGYWEDRTLREMVAATAERLGSEVAVVYRDQRITYAELMERVDRLAFQLLRHGLAPRDRVILQLPNVPEFIYAFLALDAIGVIPVLALRPHRKTEVSHFVRHSGAVGYFIPDLIGGFDYRAMAEEIRAEQPHLRRIFVAGEPGDGQISLGALLEADVAADAVRGAIAAHRSDPGDVALMLLSGGTTALPKLIPRTDNDYVYNAKACAAAARLTAASVFLAVLPMAHNYTLSSPGVLGAFAAGARVVIAPAADGATVMSLVEQEGVTVISAGVPLVVSWLNATDLDGYDLSSLELIQNGGARLAPELRGRLRERFGCAFQEVFGTAEGLVNFTGLDDDDEIVLHSSGAPASPADEIKVVDPAGREVPEGEPGELLVRGPYTIRGYYNAPENNAKGFTEDGFYRMGDIVRKRGPHLYTEGRKNDLINRGGEKISSDEVENFILRNPKVKSVCLVAMPDERFGEKACAFVILKPGERLAFDELTGFLLEQEIAKFKLPERLELVDEFPLSPAGKVLKRTLRERIAATLAAEARAGPSLPGG